MGPRTGKGKLEHAVGFGVRWHVVMCGVRPAGK